MSQVKANLEDVAAKNWEENGEKWANYARKLIRQVWSFKGWSGPNYTIINDIGDAAVANGYKRYHDYVVSGKEIKCHDALICRMVRYAVMDSVREHFRTLNYLEYGLDATETAEKPVDDAIWDMMATMILTLPVDCQSVAKLAMEGLTLTETARLLGQPRDYVYYQRGRIGLMLAAKYAHIEHDTDGCVDMPSRLYYA